MDELVGFLQANEALLLSQDDTLIKKAFLINLEEKVSITKEEATGVTIGI